MAVEKIDSPELALNLAKYAEHGFAPFAAEWQRRHAYQGKPVKLLLPDGESVKGTVAGVDSTGALVLADGPGRRLEAAAQDLIAFRTGDGLNAATPSYGGIGPILPGQWQLQPGQSVQTPWFATASVSDWVTEARTGTGIRSRVPVSA